MSPLKDLCFNSKLVRLKVADTTVLLQALELSFNSKLVRLKARARSRSRARSRFQFQTGAIKRQKISGEGVTLFHSFNSKLVRLKVS